MSSTTKIYSRDSAAIKVEWTIPDFLARCPPENDWIYSGVVHFLGYRWKFGGFGAKSAKKEELFHVAIIRIECETECNLQLRIGIKRDDGEVLALSKNLDLTFERDECHKVFRFPSFTRSALELSASALLPSGSLTYDFVVTKGDQAIRAEGLKKLSDDLSELMQSGEESDFTVSVQGKMFNLHRCILGARSPVFRCMLNHEMAGKAPGVFSIDNCEPALFRAFVHYLYTSTVDELSTDTVFGLYRLAHKYQVEGLKSFCLDFAQKTLSVETFCDVYSLAATYDLKDLLDQALEFFSQRKTRIVQRAKWVNLLKDHPKQANDLIVKGFQNTEEKIGNKRQKLDGNGKGITKKTKNG